MSFCSSRSSGDSAQPYIFVRASGESLQYNIANDIEVTIEEVQSTIYDLRVGGYVTLKIESDSVKSIVTTAPAAATSSIMGTVESVNENYYFFYLSTTNAVTGQQERVQIFVKKNGNTKYIDSADGTTLSLGKLKEGSTVLATGVKQLDGSYLATAVVVMAPPAATQN